MTSHDQYDIIIVGGGPIGLCAAYYCAVNKNKKVLVIEQFTFENNIYGSSVGFGRQFRTCYAQKNLCQLAIEAATEWDNLKTNLSNPHLLNQTGCLWLGDSSIHSSEGNIEEAVKNLEELGQDYELIKGKDQIGSRFPFIARAVDGIQSENAVALYMKNGAVINVPSLIKSLKSALETSQCTLIQSTKVTCIDYSSIQAINVSTDKGQTFTGKKVILTPGTYINEVLPSLSPKFPFSMKMIIYLWVSTYFKIKDSEAAHAKIPPSEWPLWYFFGGPKGQKGEATDYNLYYGFPCDKDDKEGYARVAPAFTSNEKFNFNNFPPATDQRKVDQDALNFTSQFVHQSMPDLENSLNPEKTSTCIVGFAELVSSKPDEYDAGAGFVLDFVPNTDHRIILTTGGWAMKFVPMFGKILADLAVDGKTSYQDLIQPMNINRGILFKDQVEMEGVACISEQLQAIKFHRIWL